MTDRPMANDRAEGFVARLCALEEERGQISGSIRDLKLEIKAAGLDPAAVALVVKRKLEAPEKARRREEREAEADRIEAALGQLADMPLGRSAIARAAAE